MTSDFTTAVAEAEAALKRGEPSLQHLHLVAWQRLQAGDRAAAIGLLEQAHGLAPHDPATLTNLGMILRLEGRLSEAIARCDQAVAADPRFVTGWVERGFVFAVGGSFQAAMESYQQALALDPAHPDAPAGLAVETGRAGDAAASRDYAHRALARDPGNVMAVTALARAEIDDRHLDRAVRLLAPLVSRLPAADDDRAVAGTLLGDACDKLGDTDVAYAAYATANADFAAGNRKYSPGGIRTSR